MFGTHLYAPYRVTDEGLVSFDFLNRLAAIYGTLAYVSLNLKLY